MHIFTFNNIPLDRLLFRFFYYSNTVVSLYFVCNESYKILKSFCNIHKIFQDKFIQITFKLREFQQEDDLKCLTLNPQSASALKFHIQIFVMSF